MPARRTGEGAATQGGHEPSQQRAAVTAGVKQRPDRDAGEARTDSGKQRIPNPRVEQLGSGARFGALLTRYCGESDATREELGLLARMFAGE